MIKYARLLLLPFSVIYGIVIIFRNKLYDLGFFKSTKFDIPVICVGNLVVGGSGKSPVTEYLVHLLADYKIAILSRGYGRDTKGFLYADQTSTAKSIGDEPLQFYHKFPQVTVAVCEDRVKGIKQLKDAHDVIILDDAFQHRRLSPGFSILLFEFQKLLETQFLLPAGNMREPFRGYKRADLLLVTKSPWQISELQKEQCSSHFNKSAVSNQLFFSSIHYKDLQSLFSSATLNIEDLKNKKIFLLTGIANPKPLFDYLLQFSPAIEHHDYPDHHSFSSGNLSKLVKAYIQDQAKEKIIITTEKDAQRLFDVTIKELLLNLPVFYLPININIEADCKKTFDQKILKYVSDTTRDR
ncbi:tetraacyldisaccharide 4'-kinase [Pedobacter cryoconitis]|uniref:Tetraacyldisaccharide 4'-kinase n=1 Tax=Pedobacter cryoconitis TaxID=188932 RepID=A0A7W9DYB5_9SPHI|nr:tetraacyldisaccharide 4'-kinase [Pedobacter cryoconitis]MBB5636052.1 tetraacyldisaccharide 4'-kinase [Pedobacter cryoconitis]